MSRRHASPQSGFTLLELLIAIAIFAIVAVLAMGGFNQMISHRDHANETMARTRAIQRAVLRLSLDFAQLEPRPVRDATAATTDPAVMVQVNANNAYLIEFTRAGWSNPTGQPRPSLQRVTYRLTDGKLYRDYWPVLDRTLNTKPVQVELLTKVSNLSLRFMDGNKLWQTTWGTTRARMLPLAVEITLNLEDWGEIKRVVEVATG